MLTFPYESSESPPAPYIDLQLCPARHPESRLRLRAKLDSGAALTVIPHHLATQWQLHSYANVHVQAFNGTPSTRPLYYVDFLIGSQWFRRIEVTTTQRTNILLGRDILNQLCIIHDGPRQTVKIEAHFSIWGKLKSWFKL